MFENEILYGVISNPKGEVPYRRIQFRLLSGRYQIEKFTEKQAFHGFCERAEMNNEAEGMLGMVYRQLDAWDRQFHYCLKISKKGKATLFKQKDSGHADTEVGHNREKQYILKENTEIPPLVDLGVFTKDGKVVRTMYDKFRQINRFTELIRDGMEELEQDSVRILDFGCGKSYLTFAMYYYLRELEGFDVNIIGLDLKEDVIRHCSELARSYGYDKLHFYQGDIAGYEGVSSVDMVVTLHACDTATDFALAKAVEWGAQVILSVPCCQHELNRQIRNEMLQPVMRYGILKERMAALITDGLRAELLESKGYETQLLEFIDMEHTPKNILIRAVKTGKKKSRDSFSDTMKALHVAPTLDRLLYPEESASQKGE